MTSTMSTSSAGARPATSPLMASLYGGIATGLIGAAFMMLLSAKLPILYGLAFILIGAGLYAIITGEVVEAPLQATPAVPKEQHSLSFFLLRFHSIFSG